MSTFHPLTSTITELLTLQHCWFETFEHPPVRTSEEAAQLRHGYTLHQGAKALIVRIKRSKQEKFFCMVVIPGDAKFDKQKLLNVFQAKDVRFATPEEVADITAGVQPGGVPPFGNLFSLKVVVDPSLLKNEKIIFNAGDRSFSIAMKSEDYRSIVQPRIEQVT